MEQPPVINFDDAAALDAASGNAPGFSISLLSSLDDCIKVLGPDGEMLFMSCNGRKTMEIDDFASIRGAPWPSLWPEPQRDLVQRAVDEARKGNTAEFEALCPTGKGTPKVWSVTVIPMLDRTGAVERIVATSRDVTDRANLTRKLRDRAIELERSVEETRALLAERDHLIAEMDHRVKNSLSLVSTMIRLQKREVEGEDAHEALDTAAMRVLAVARVHEGLQARQDDRNVEVAPFLTSLMEDLDEVMGATPPVAIRIDPTLAVAGGKASHLGLIAVELVQNARKHAQGVGIPISLSVQRAGDEAELTVCDRGPGLPEEFNVLRQGGLGLKVCASGAAMLGSELEAANQDGGGAIFKVKFTPA